ncbi:MULTISPECIES: hypothetical protein [unclassified Streptomyces]|uniref:hypothetical protein n=1 Tax=unclassified Streptomyces TaxID=2593676 RepID=UPI0006F4789B|nr:MULTISPECIES: hypothetical protein [unclassified Streptomyces]KQX53262.1 hypothetical protein ASD33_08710 [Streptomyces sp. Root1304]KRA90183.1 hypothetical protein ASE09_08715 [Streptomyces sp. Root66D1]
MARIVGVHGIGWSWRSREEMHETWHGALTTGLKNIRYADAATVSFEAAYYGHLYNAGTGKSGGGALYTAADVADGFEYELLEAMAREADPAAFDEDSDEPASKGGVVRGAQACLSILERTPYLGGMTASVLIRQIKQVHRYFEEPALGEEIRAELETAIQEDTRVVLAHSLGSVAAYEVLWKLKDVRIDTLVTMGSPLGLKSIRRRLARSADAEPGRPPSVRRWVNVAAEQDVVALRKKLKTLYNDEVEDFVVANPLLHMHDCTRYLANLRTARAVEAALG